MIWWCPWARQASASQALWYLIRHIHWTICLFTLTPHFIIDCEFAQIWISLTTANPQPWLNSSDHQDHLPPLFTRGGGWWIAWKTAIYNIVCHCARWELTSYPLPNDGHEVKIPALGLPNMFELCLNSTNPERIIPLLVARWNQIIWGYRLTNWEPPTVTIVGVSLLAQTPRPL